VLLFKCKRRLSIRIENKLKNNSAFRNIAVNFYDIFRCPKCLLFNPYPAKVENMVSS